MTPAPATAGTAGGAASAALRAAIAEDMRQIPAGFCEMGTPKSRYEADRDSPRRRVKLSGFQISAVTVSNRIFARFIEESGYVTTAGREGWSFVFHLFLAEPKVWLTHPAGTPWWRRVTGADWAHPEGPESDLAGREDHPVTHVSWHDAEAFAAFTGTSLPSEAQWEYAARGGLTRMKFPWGNDLTPAGRHGHNIWQGRFPDQNSAEDGFAGTAPVRAFSPNGYGLFNMTGNVWEWTADSFGPLPAAQHPPRPDPVSQVTGGSKVMRGGSHLCHDSYCGRYFVHSRSHNTAESSTGHIGFRVIGADTV
ncbi:formylglycine-generating enzyme family protein [Paracoccus sp. IB05]|uniref:formylglycine-generating enzyme family protein n=1 Tax=Paracoccus sp. IB05 TaxID=2779367 RepID=UPI0018E837DE|nr:formylglycine-generating enzyme family protein [Paracoccus sp. IB05]MBJ2150941.1 formylglycine-generating enzyme family protein [Paracoccus sp. IB05]